MGGYGACKGQQGSPMYVRCAVAVRARWVLNAPGGQGIAGRRKSRRGEEEEEEVGDRSAGVCVRGGTHRASMQFMTSAIMRRAAKKDARVLRPSSRPTP